jgi:epoxide hydrolase 4
MEFSDNFIEVNGQKIHTVTLNGNISDPEAIPFLLVHGFPECWYSWRYVMPLLANPPNGKKYKVVAIDLRGYNLSSKPKWVKNYRIPTLTLDIVGVIKKINPSGKVYLVGHDWGGALCWEVARYHAKLVEKLFILNCPPIEILFKGLFNVPKQILSSYYIFFFQIPFLPEFLFKKFGLIPKMYARIKNSEGNYLSKKEVETYTNAFKGPRAFNGINFYRAALRDVFRGRIIMHPPKVKIFTKVIWGTKDVALNVGLTRFFKGIVEKGKLRMKYLPKGTHSVQQNCPEECAQEILKHIK